MFKMLKTLPSILSATKSGCFIIFDQEGVMKKAMCVQIVTLAKIILEPGSNEGCVTWGGREEKEKGSRRSVSPKGDLEYIFRCHASLNTLWR